MSKFLPFDEALAVARSLNLPGRMEWRVWCKEGMCPPNVPSTPGATYKDGGWQGWGHWLGTGNQSSKAKREQFLPFDEALAFAQSLNLANHKEWEAWCKEGVRPPNVPADPRSAYKDGGWEGWGHWLGTGNQHTKDFLPFDEALVVVRSLGLPGRTEWRVLCKEGMCPLNVPSHPGRTYKDGGWEGWGHWLGTGNKVGGAKEFLPFVDALVMALSLGLANRFE